MGPGLSAGERRVPDLGHGERKRLGRAELGAETGGVVLKRQRYHHDPSRCPDGSRKAGLRTFIFVYCKGLCRLTQEGNPFLLFPAVCAMMTPLLA